MATTSAQTDIQSNPERKLIAPLWHTFVLVLLMIAYAYHGQTSVGRIERLHLTSKVPLYLYMIALELVLVSYVWFLGVKPRGGNIRGLIGGKWNTFGDVMRDIGVAFLFWLVVIVMLAGLRFSLGNSQQTTSAVSMLAPGSLSEAIVWVVLSVTAGVCEEFIFRGYLQKQFFAITGMNGVAIAGQALVFGVAHGYQGVKGMTSIAIYGALFGILAMMRKSLRPGIMQHGAQDTMSGIAGMFLKKYHYLQIIKF